MGKMEYAPKTLLYPVPVLLVSSGTADGRTNIMTAGWTGTICTEPPMAYVSIRPSRASYGMIRNSGEFVLNLNTEALAAAADQCGVISMNECEDKWALTSLTRGKALWIYRKEGYTNPLETDRRCDLFSDWKTGEMEGK